MSDANVTTLIRIAGALAIAGCLWLAYTVLRPYPEASIMLFGVATFLYGVIGFKPADPVLAHILQRLNPAIVAALSTRPPAPTFDSIKVDLNDPKASIVPTSTLTEAEFQKLHGATVIKVTPPAYPDSIGAVDASPKEPPK